jgi:hypothetical protein
VAEKQAGDKKDEKGDAAATARVADLEKQVGEARRRIEGHLGSLVDARSPYRELGTLYKGLLAGSTAEPGKQVAEMRAAFGLPSGTVALGEKPELATELQAMALARALLNNEETRGEAIAALREIAANGIYTRVSAGLALAHIARSPDERGSALALLETILAAQPEQESFLGPEIARLKAAKER